MPTKGVLSRAIGMVFSPGSTFQDVVSSPRPAGILLLVCLVMGFATGLPQFTERGRQASLDMQVQQIEKFTGQPVAPEAYAAMEGRAKYTGYITIGSMFVVLPVACLFFAALYWVAFNAILGGTASFKQVLGIMTHSQVIGALGAVVSAPIQFMQGTQTATGPFNLGALAPMLESGSILADILGAISVFTIWQIIVTAVGLGVLYKRRPGTISVVLLIIYVLLVSLFTVGMAKLLGR
ncbi:MAG: YIP1 family protein [Burkholderiales bacterium]